MRNGWIFNTSIVAFLVTGCAVATGEPQPFADELGCEPGMPYECACATGQPGTQVCDEVGAALSACDCGGEGDLPAATGTGGASSIPASGGSPPITGTGGVAPVTSTGGVPPIAGAGGEPPLGGAGGVPPEYVLPEVIATGGTPPEVGGAGGTPPVITTGTCCSDGDCLCHGPDPSGLTSSAGPFATANYPIGVGTVYYPTNAEPPFAGVAVCGGFTNTGPEMTPWAPFYASHGIVTIITTTTGLDDPTIRATKLLAAITALKGENTSASSPLFGMMAGRYGTSGYSMGGGGTTIASGQDSTLMTSVGLAPWGPNGSGVTVPTLLLCGASDTVAPCSQSQGAYTQIPGTTPKMMVTIAGATHFNWFGPTDAGAGTSGKAALAFQKVYLEGDERWRPFLLQSGGTVNTNIQ